MDTFLTKWPPNGHFGWDDNVNYRTRPRYLDVSSLKNASFKSFKSYRADNDAADAMAVALLTKT